MRILGTVAVALLIAGGAQAQQLAPPAPEDLPAAAAPLPDAPPGEVTAESPPPEVPAIVPRLSRDEAPAAPEPAAAADPFTRGSFWWYVGIIVVAGVILAVVL